MITPIAFNSLVFRFIFILHNQSYTLPRHHKHLIANILIRNSRLYILAHRNGYSLFIYRGVFIHDPADTGPKLNIYARGQELVELSLNKAPALTGNSGIILF